MHAADERRQSASARAAGGAEAFRVLFRPADQVVDRSLRVRDEVSSHTFTHETALRRRVQVLIDRPACRRRLELRIVGLLSFALTDRIEGQRYKTLQRQVGCESLRLRLTFLGVA